MKSHHFLFVLLILIFMPAVPSCRTCEKESKQPRPQDAQTITIALTNLPTGAKPLEMILIRPGEFTMGSAENSRSRLSREWLPHKVTLTEAFYLGKYEVTQAQWRAVMGTNPAKDHGVGDDVRSGLHGLRELLVALFDGPEVPDEAVKRTHVVYSLVFFFTDSIHSSATVFDFCTVITAST